MRLFISIFIFLNVSHSYGQQLSKIEQELLSQFKRLHYWVDYKGTDHIAYRYDSIEQANEIFRKNLLAYTSSSRATITYDFKDLEKEGLIITTSQDGLLRIYSWDTYTGGTEHIFDAIYQYKTDNKIYSKIARTDEDDAGRWYSVIHSLKSDDKIYYIGIYHEIHSTKYLYQGVKLFCIENNGLNETLRLIKTKTGIRNEIGFEFDQSSIINRPEYPVKLIYYEEDEDKLQLAVVSEEGKVTKRFITYLFTGKYFEEIGMR